MRQVHPLRKYLQDVAEPVADFAARVGASRQTLYRIMNGQQSPKPGLARRIEQATGGVVPIDRLFRGGDDGGAIIGIDIPCASETTLDQVRVQLAIAIVVSHLAPQDAPERGEDVYQAAAEAVLNTYAALAPITSRLGPDRLTQALRPVLEEMLQEISACPPTSAVLDRGAQLACDIYYQSPPAGSQ